MADALTRRQQQLLDEVAASWGGGHASQQGGVSAQEEDAANGLQYEAFYRHWKGVEAEYMKRSDRKRRSRWEWVEKVHQMCGDVCSELDTSLSLLGDLDNQRQEVVRKTTALHEQCEQMVRDQERLSETTEAISKRLDLFDRVADIARVLDMTNSATAHPDFSSILDQLDESISFLEIHYDFHQAQAYLHQFEHLRNRACISIRSAVQKSLEKSVAQVDQQLKEKAREGTVETSVFYVRFRAAALNHKPLLSLLHKRIDAHETYAVTLEELEMFYTNLRIKLVQAPLGGHLASTLKPNVSTTQLASSTRQASAYILDLCQLERQCFEAYFELRSPQEALRILLEHMGNLFYTSMRPLVLSCNSIDSLREMADCLQMDVLEPQQANARSADLVPVLTIIFRLHKDVQERLIFQVQSYIRDDIKAYRVTDQDLDYPAILYPAVGSESEDPNRAPGAQAYEKGWFPTMQRTLGVLSKIYRVLEMSTFQGLAQEAVDVCVASLKHNASVIRQQAPSSNTKPTPLAPMALILDAQLFLIKHLLILREQVAAFECDLVTSEKFFDFSKVWDILKLKLPQSIDPRTGKKVGYPKRLLDILTPKLQESQVDSKKDIEAELKAACEELITCLTSQVAYPLVALNTQIADFQSKPGNADKPMKTQPFMAPDNLKEVINGFLANVKERIPVAAALIRLYLTSPAAGEKAQASHSTASILFRPVQVRLVDAWGQLESLLEEQQMVDQLQNIGFIRPDALRDMISSTFDELMEAQWGTIVDMVDKIPRPKKKLPTPPPQPTPAAQPPPAVDGPAQAPQGTPAGGDLPPPPPGGGAADVASAAPTLAPANVAAVPAPPLPTDPALAGMPPAPPLAVASDAAGLPLPPGMSAAGGLPPPPTMPSAAGDGGLPLPPPPPP